MSSDLVFEFLSELNGFEELSAITSFLLFKVFDVLFLSNIFDDKSGFVEAILLWLFNDEFIRLVGERNQLIESLVYQNNPKLLKSFKKRMKNLKRGLNNDSRLLTNYTNKKNRYK